MSDVVMISTLNLQDPAVAALYQRVDKDLSSLLYERLHNHNRLYLAAEDYEWLRQTISTLVEVKGVASSRLRDLTPAERQATGSFVYYERHPLGALVDLLENESILDFHIDGPDQARILYRDGRQEQIELAFKDENALQKMVVAFFADHQPAVLLNEASPSGALLTPSGDYWCATLQGIASSTTIDIIRH